ncbi:TPA: Dam family site-specific DNA-(adenine-N6)-methyltransferase [Mannheimia haemolytica]|uniref:Site-specific DNA-methyltransferase (adenine-specific) n=1 Tax=Mannheimia haemolytica TaxID=75985 RepID=A0A378NFB5_MANHA|nr:Dam family site-specific DNA-(adenine-N6)-methyltransferase [Mannheimia haemolytica]AGQ38206.1 DNA adenine methylase [Mannheimia haemolytica D171]EEY09174.1 DNA adenine methylase [Mannheimia haemolytica serotype A2 str. OVINE]EEY12203.1 DNA adenine methylase [Mannheimia haemolytica serotype A2 str. BOVINE]KYL18210.1 DNA adenine methylase [Mannheimia haemolytica]KYL22445.1 DNA adenine methylase [Mannheimia haemolytica]
MNHPKHRAFLKWAGGKYRLIPDIQTHLPKKACLVEPFVGAGSVFLNTDFERYILADINPDLINLFNVVKADVEEYIAQTKQLFLHPQANTEAFYKACRAEFNRSKDIFRRSVIFLYLNRFGYNGLCRYNQKKGYNVPFGRYKTHYFPEKELRFFAEKAQKATFVCADFEQVFELAKNQLTDYVIYCDPPYAPLAQETNFTQYAGGGFSLEQQGRLATLALEMKGLGVPVLISNHDTDFTRRIYQSADITQIQVQRSIGQKVGSRVKVGELFALFI